MRSRGLMLVVIMLTAVLAGYPGASVSAHSYLEGAEPAAGATVESMPQVLSLTYSERLEAAFSRIMVFAPDGARVDLGDVAAQGRTLQVSLTDAGPGSYCVEWAVVSAEDGHTTSGAHPFHVEQASPATCPVPAQERDETRPETAGDDGDQGLPFFAGDPAWLVTALLALLVTVGAAWLIRARRQADA